MKKLPVHSRDGRVRTSYDASAMICGVREWVTNSAPTTLRMAAVSIDVRGHRELAAMPSSRSSSLRPRVTRLIPYLAMAYPVNRPNHFGSVEIGGDSVRMCGLFDDLRSQGMDSFDNRNEPRQLMSFIRSYAFIGKSSVLERLMALALLTTTSMPPNCAAVCSTALATKSSS